MSPEGEYPPRVWQDPDRYEAEPFYQPFHVCTNDGTHTEPHIVPNSPSRGLDPDPLNAQLVDDARTAVEAHRGRRSSSKVVLLALGVGAALGFVAGWAAK